MPDQLAMLGRGGAPGGEPAVSDGASSSEPERASDDARLEWIRHRRNEIAATRIALMREDGALLWEQKRLCDRRASIVTAPPAASRPTPAPALTHLAAPSGSRWNLQRVRDLLLWVGGVLLVLSAVSLAAVLWTRDQPQGQPLMTASRIAVVLAAVAVVCVTVTRLLVRRLPATAEVVGTVFLAVTATDWYVIRRAGVADTMPVLRWLAVGAAAAAVLAIATRVVLRLRAPLVSAPLFGLAALSLATFPLPHQAWTVAVIAAADAAGAVIVAGVLGRRGGWRVPAVVVAGGAVVLSAVGMVAAVVSLSDITNTNTARGPTVAVAAIAVPAGLAWLIERRRWAATTAIREVLVAVVWFAVLGAVTVQLAARLPAPVCLAGLAWLGAVVVTVGLGGGRRGVAVAGAVTVAAGASLAVGRAIVAAVAPIQWWGNHWALPPSATAASHLSRPESPTLYHDWWWATAAAGALAAISLAVGMRSRTARTTAIRVGAVVAAVTVIDLVAMGAAVNVATVVVVDLAVVAAGMVAAAVVRDEHNTWTTAAIAVIAAVSVSGWVLTSRSVTIAATITVAVATAVAATITPNVELRRILTGIATLAALTSAAIVAVATTGRPAPTGLTLTGAAVVAAVSATILARRRDIADVATVAVIVGIALTASSPTALAAAFTIAAAGDLAAVTVATLRRLPRHGFDIVAPLLCAAAVTAWLAVAHVHLLEAYSLTIAAALTAFGVLLNHWSPTPSSWSAYAAGLLAGFAPTLVRYLYDNNTARLVGLVTLATAVTITGAVHRLQAPMLIGAAVLLTVAVDALQPAAAALPRWIPLGIAGIVVLWAGATFERRITTLRHWRHRLHGFH